VGKGSALPLLGVAALLETLPAPSTDGVYKVCQQLKDIPATTPTQQEKSSLQRWAEVSISTLSHSKVGGQRAIHETPELGTASSPAPISAHDQLSHADAQPGPLVNHQNH
jgi:hypothetical protein